MGSEVRPDYYKIRVRVTDVDEDDGDGYVEATVECFELIDALADDDFHLGNAIKYIFRRKGPSRMEDIKKAKTYLAEWIHRHGG